jgi:hypothetical protein
MSVYARKLLCIARGRSGHCSANGRSIDFDEHADGARPAVVAAYGGTRRSWSGVRDHQCRMGRMGNTENVAYAALFPAVFYEK